MSDTRRVVLREIEEGSLEDIVQGLSIILKAHPTAYLVKEWQDYDNCIPTVYLDIPKTKLDIDAEYARGALNEAIRKQHPLYEIVIEQTMPISQEKLDSIKQDGKNDYYVLSDNKCVLSRRLSEDERQQVIYNRKVGIESLQANLNRLYKLQEEQDKKYVM